MHSDREKLVERLHHAITTASNDDMSRPGTHMRERHTARLAAIEDAIAALSEPVKDEPVVQWRVGEWGDGSTKPGEAVIFCDAHEAAVAAGVPSHLAKMIVEAHNDTVTRPAGERPAVAVKPLEWHPSNTGMSGDTHTTPTLYTVRFVDDRDGWRWMGLGGHGYEVTAEAAKAAAQADYERRIKSALTAEPQAVPEGMVLVPKEPASFAWVDELYQAVEAIGKRPTDFTMRELLLWYRAMLAASPAVQGGE